MIGYHATDSIKLDDAWTIQNIQRGSKLTIQRELQRHHMTGALRKTSLAVIVYKTSLFEYLNACTIRYYTNLPREIVGGSWFCSQDSIDVRSQSCRHCDVILQSIGRRVSTVVTGCSEKTWLQRLDPVDRATDGGLAVTAERTEMDVPCSCAMYTTQSPSYGLGHVALTRIASLDMFEATRQPSSRLLGMYSLLH